MRTEGFLLAAALFWGVPAQAGCSSPAAPPGAPGIGATKEQGGGGEKSEADGRASPERGQAEACLSLSEKLWDRDPLESLRLLRRGAGLRDVECCRRYLALAETDAVTLSQRVYARLYIEGQLRKGPLTSRGGDDVRGPLYYQLCWAWRHSKPGCLPKARQVLQAMLETSGAVPESGSAFIAQLREETGLRRDVARGGPGARQEVQLYAGESAESSRFWLQAPILPERREPGDWMLQEANVWGGGSDRLLLATNVLALLVNERGEPAFRGSRLWICNLGTAPVYLTALGLRVSHRELVPGREEILGLAGSGPDGSAETTVIPLSVRYRRGTR